MSKLSDKEYLLKLANILYRMFELRFNRDWDDLPEEVKQEYIENAEDLLNQMSEKNILHQLVYAVGYKHGDSYGMVYGPSPSLRHCMEFIPEKSTEAHLLFFDADGDYEIVKIWRRDRWENP